MARTHQRLKKALKPSGIEAIVCRDIAKRQRLGISKYGVTVAKSPEKLRAWLMHSYLETLDKAVYTRRAIAEIDKKLRKRK